MPQVSDSKYLVTAGWNDVPHLNERTKAELLAATPVHLRRARAEGIPALGSGAVFPIAEELIVVAPFKVPSFWVQIGGLDFGWDHPTGAAKLAWDRDTDTIYVVSDYRQREQTPLLAAAALKPWGDWLPWSWPHDGLQHDKGSGEELAGQYRKHGLKMLHERATFVDGSNGLEAGLMDMLDRMQTGRWKVFASCGAWLEEFRLYHRKDGLVVKKLDDVISASRYAMMMLRFAVRPQDAMRAQLGTGNRSQGPATKAGY